MSDLLRKPLADHLTGLISKLDQREDADLHQPLIDCAMFLLIELARLDGVTL